MGHRDVPSITIPSRVVATGFTTAFLGDERTLREFVVGDAVVRAMREIGENAVLYLINDSYDPLDRRQLRVGVNKDAELIRQFEPWCGRPIAEIPDPWGCHASYSDHFLAALVERLNGLDIHPAVIDVHRAYRAGYYAPLVAATFDRYDEIRDRIAATHENYTLRNLVRIQCPKCDRIDVTEIERVTAREVTVRCERCDLSTTQERISVRGKLSWKLDCAARWNLYGIHTETFSKAHLADKGTFTVSRLASQEFYGGHVPEVVKYGDIRLDPRLSGRLLDILPPKILKDLLASRLTHDLDLTPAFLEHFAATYEVRPGLSYDGFVRKVLPRAAIEQPRPAPPNGSGVIDPVGLSDQTLITHGNRYSQFFYRRSYALRLPDERVFKDASLSALQASKAVVHYALTLRAEGRAGDDTLKAQLKIYLATIPSGREVFPLLRRVFAQKDGANITTLLAVLPCDYLTTIHFILDTLTGQARKQGDHDHDVDDDARKAA